MTFTFPKASEFNLRSDAQIFQFLSKDETVGNQSQDEADININLNYEAGQEGSTRYTLIAEPGEFYIITELIIQVLDEGRIKFDKFGSDINLTNGVIAIGGAASPPAGPPVELPRGFVVKQNSHWPRYMSEVSILQYDANKEQLYINWRFNPQGHPTVLDGDIGQFLGIRVDEDLSGLDSFTVHVHGIKISKRGL